MMTLMYGVALAAAVWWLARLFAQGNPTVMAKRMKQIGGVLALAVAALLFFRGRFDMGFLLGGVGLWLLGWSGFGPAGFGARTKRSPGSVSRVRSAMIEMELDHDTGDMDGTVLAGGFGGRKLQALDEGELKRLYEECRAADPDGVRLLEAYLDRRFAGRREHAERHGDPGAGGRAQAGAMTEEEAYQILGLQPGASADDVRRAHRTLMKKLHPDQGGTTYLAARINEAKDVLLSRHR
ncbi:MAG TPA: DnaJ domain-containing protein [Beijerinckiaceae bacterium]|nr:DnaJ domain-containing protein [Beijerinckiaceae bacterium]